MVRPIHGLALLTLLAPAPLVAQGNIPRVTRVGAAKPFGPGILYATVRELRFELSRDAEVIVLMVDPAGAITPMFPTDSEPGRRPAGIHILNAPILQETTAGEEPRLSRRVQSA